MLEKLKKALAEDNETARWIHFGKEARASLKNLIEQAPFASDPLIKALLGELETGQTLPNCVLAIASTISADGSPPMQQSEKFGDFARFWLLMFMVDLRTRTKGWRRNVSHCQLSFDWDKFYAKLLQPGEAAGIETLKGRDHNGRVEYCDSSGKPIAAELRRVPFLLKSFTAKPMHSFMVCGTLIGVPAFCAKT